MRRGFVTAGTWCLDRNVTLTHWPGEDMTATASDVVLSGGGSACNFAVGMRRLDPAMPVETMGLVGTDAEGELLIAQAERWGIDTARIARTADAPTHLSEAFQSIRSGRRTHILYEGTSALLSPRHFDFSGMRAKCLHLGLPGLHALMDAPWGDDANGWAAVLRAARAEGLEANLELVAVEAPRLRALALPCLPHLTTLVVNDYEIGAIAGMTTVGGGEAIEDACRDAALTVLSRGAMEAVVVHHPRGAVLCAKDGSVVVKPSVRVPEAARAGANGAGDAFAVGYLHARHEGAGHEECLALGHAVAAASLRAVTTTDGIAGRDACLALAREWGWR